MHTIEPYYNWLNLYDTSRDALSPFYGKKYDFTSYTDTIYNYYIDPAWDYIGSDTLFLKILYADYHRGFTIIELLGEWNDAINNDIMHLKRNIIDHMVAQGISQFILLGQSVFNFHASDDSYYEEWFDDIEEGWIAAIDFHDFVYEEWKKYNLDYYIIFGGDLEMNNWRTFSPIQLYERVNQIFRRRISLE
ncbi:MAG: hypothetical protein ACFCUU_13345 [Cyclobacteriaceae bacterium]